MVKQISFTKYQQELLPGYRQKINISESTEDVRKCFIYTVQELMKHVFEGKAVVDYDDVELAPGAAPYYRISERLLSSGDFQSVWNNSDLSHMMDKLAETAVNRCKRLEKHPEKTSSKIRN
jgi:hypothetical protein